MWLTFWRKTVVFFNLTPFTGLIKNSCLNNSKFSPVFATIKHVTKKTFLNISVLVSEIVNFMAKKKSLHEFLPKFFKTTERHSLAVCGSLCGEKQFLLISNLYYRFVKKKLFKQIQIFLRICSFSNTVRKTNWLSISVLVFAIVTFMSKKKSSLWISTKMLQNNQKA